MIDLDIFSGIAPFFRSAIEDLPYSFGDCTFFSLRHRRFGLFLRGLHLFFPPPLKVWPIPSGIAPFFRSAIENLAYSFGDCTFFRSAIEDLANSFGDCTFFSLRYRRFGQFLSGRIAPFFRPLSKCSVFHPPSNLPQLHQKLNQRHCLKYAGPWCCVVVGERHKQSLRKCKTHGIHDSVRFDYFIIRRNS
jgi:hypothetical protein